MAELELHGDLPAVVGSPTPSLIPSPTEATRDNDEPDALTLSAARMTTLIELFTQQAPIGFAILDRDLRYVFVNQTLADANGLTRDAHLGHTVVELLPAVAPHIVPLLEAVLDTGDPVLDLHLRTGPTPARPGRSRAWAVSYYPLVTTSDAGHVGIEGIGMIVSDETDAVAAVEHQQLLLQLEHEATMRANTAAEAAEDAARRQHFLQRVASDLAPAMTRDDIASIAAELARETFGVDVARLDEYDADTDSITLLAVHDHATDLPAERTFPLEALPPARDALTTGRPVAFQSLEERDLRYPQMRGARRAYEAWAFLPMLSQGKPVGVAAFGWREPRRISSDDLDLLSSLATQCTIALERVRLLESAEEARSRLDILARAGEVLGGSLDEDEVLQRLADLLVPELTDWLLVALVDDRGMLSPRMSVTLDPRLTEPAQRAMTFPPLPISLDTPPTRALRTRRPQVLPAVIAGSAGPDVPSGVTDTLVAMHPGQGLCVPMLAGDHVIGVLSLITRDDRYSRLMADVGLVTDLARRAAFALDNARLFGQRSRVAARLQTSLLPAELSPVAGAVVKARYATAEEAVDVGGDFYDVIPLPGGARLLVIGDVSGRGIEAAGTTGLARHTLRALARDTTPGQALARLNDVLVDDDQGGEAGAEERFLTAVCVRYEPADTGARLVVARAGHTHPLVVRADGRTEFLCPEGPLLGALETVVVEELELTLARGDSLVLHTDGIIETRCADEEFGEDRLAAAAASGARACPDPVGVADAIADAVLDAVTAFESAPSGDDRALLVLHVTD